MPVTEITTDPENLTMTVVVDASVPVARLWTAFTDPRQLERFWGPPGWPATFTAWDFTPGGRVDYRMTSPQGHVSAGSWEVVSIDQGSGFTVLDTFVGEDGAPLDGFPTLRMVFDFEATDDGSRLSTTTYFASLDALEQVVAMGAIEGTRQAMDQLDAVLADLREFAAGKGTMVELLDDTHVRITRLVDGPRELVWRAYNEEELMRKWMLGPDGWEMTECVIATEPGATHRTSWAPVGDTEGEPFGFEGEVLLVDAPRRAVTTERMAGTEGPQTLNDLNLYEEDGATLITVLIEYPDRDTRDMILATGMAEGMEASYARLERSVLAEA